MKLTQVTLGKVMMLSVVLGSPTNLLCVNPADTIPLSVETNKGAAQRGGYPSSMMERAPKQRNRGATRRRNQNEPESILEDLVPEITRNILNMDPIYLSNLIRNPSHNHHFSSKERERTERPLGRDLRGERDGRGRRGRTEGPVGREERGERDGRVGRVGREGEKRQIPIRAKDDMDLLYSPEALYNPETLYNGIPSREERNSLPHAKHSHGRKRNHPKRSRDDLDLMYEKPSISEALRKRLEKRPVFQAVPMNERAERKLIQAQPTSQAGREEDKMDDGDESMVDERQIENVQKIAQDVEEIKEELNELANNPRTMPLVVPVPLEQSSNRRRRANSSIIPLSNLERRKPIIHYHPDGTSHNTLNAGSPYMSEWMQQPQEQLEGWENEENSIYGRPVPLFPSSNRNSARSSFVIRPEEIQQQTISDESSPVAIVDPQTGKLIIPTSDKGRMNLQGNRYQRFGRKYLNIPAKQTGMQWFQRWIKRIVGEKPKLPTFRIVINDGKEAKAKKEK